MLIKIRETDFYIRKKQRVIDELANSHKIFVEELKPAVVSLFRDGLKDGCRTLTYMEGSYGDESIQVDLIVINGSEAIVVVGRPMLTVDDVNEHIERMGRVRRFCPEYKGFKFYGAVAGKVVPEDVVKYAFRKGFFVLVHHGENVEIKNDEKFKTREW